ncbi:hypothetical protein OB920_08445 [Halobacteria archaeon HArc-gm2]|nr:hypothetical protein [Halobacteria archaeon HArc-gm2]
MTGDEPNVKAMFAGVQMTLLAIVFLIVGESIDALSGVGLLLAVAGTAVTSIAIKR